MKKRNCPNCGAPYDVHLSKCPYCGTSYFDMSALDFNDQEPFYLKIRYGDMTITQLVVPCFNDMSIESSSDYVDIYSGVGNAKLTRYCRSHNIKTNISFQAVDSGNGHLCEIVKEVKK